MTSWPVSCRPNSLEPNLVCDKYGEDEVLHDRMCGKCGIFALRDGLPLPEFSLQFEEFGDGFERGKALDVEVLEFL